MDDMNAFERQVAGEFVRRAGPVRPVNAAAILTAVTATQSSKWGFQSMFGATKFVVAGAIVALFGGFLLAGVLTQPSDEAVPAAVTSSPSLTTTEELLSGMVTEEVEPGVYRVLSDGAGHDLVAGSPVGLTIGPDGDVVVFTPEPDTLGYPVIDTSYVLGREPGLVAWPEKQVVPVTNRHGISDFRETEAHWFDAAVDHGGRLWARLGAHPIGGRLGRHDGLLGRADTDAWTLPTWPDGSDGVDAIEVTADGVVWLTQATIGPGPKVARIEDGEWTVIPVGESGLPTGEYVGESTQFAAAPDGTAWLSTGYDGSPVPGLPGLLHFDGERWAAVDLPVDPRFEFVGPLALGPDGTLWVYVAESADLPRREEAKRLLRLMDGEWAVFEDVPALYESDRFGARLAVDADGTLWIAFDGQPEIELPAALDTGPADGPPRSGERHGVLSFDGSTWRQYLGGRMVNRVVVAQDGSMWATSLSDCAYGGASCEDIGGGGVYVITPEAVAATE